MDGDEIGETNEEQSDSSSYKTTNNDDFDDNKEDENENETEEKVEEKVEKKEEETLVENDEEEGQEKKEARGSWGNYLQFIFSCLGFAVGLGNVWRFPYLCYKHGGGTFLIPYFTMAILLGAPGFFLEVCLGQYSAQGPVTCWGFATLFRGVGFAGVTVAFLISIFYNIINTWSLFYFISSFRADLEWAKCRKPWANEEICRNLKGACKTLSGDNCNYCGFFFNVTAHTCQNSENSSQVASVSKYNSEVVTRLSGYEYFDNYVIGYTKEFAKSTNKLTDLGEFQWHLWLCLAVLWIAICLVLVKGIRSLGKVSYVTASAPYVLLTILLFQGAVQEGASEGIKYYLNPDFSKLLTGVIWVEAATQIFFSLSVSMGGLIALSSYNKFDNNVLRDTLIVVIGNSMTSIYAGFVVFSYIGFLANQQGVEVKDFAKAGPTLVFGVYPMAITLLPAPYVWSALFFMTLISLGFNTMLVLTQTTITTLHDLFPHFLKTKLLIPGVCLFCFILATPMTFQGGLRILGTMDSYSAGWNALLISVLQCVALAHVYGIRRWLDDVEIMIGADRRIIRIPWRIWRYFWFATWYVISPLIGCILIILNFHDKASKPADEGTHWSMLAFGYCCTMASILFIIGTMIYDIITTPGSLRDRIKTLTTPRPSWGDAQRMYLATEETELKPNMNQDEAQEGQNDENQSETSEVNDGNNNVEESPTSTQEIQDNDNSAELQTVITTQD